MKLRHLARWRIARQLSRLPTAAKQIRKILRPLEDSQGGADQEWREKEIAARLARVNEGVDVDFDDL